LGNDQNRAGDFASHAANDENLCGPGQIQRLGAFDFGKYTPIIVEKSGSAYTIQDGMTRVEAARRAGLTKLVAYVFEEI
jgi:hypothetical protein